MVVSRGRLRLAPGLRLLLVASPAEQGGREAHAEQPKENPEKAARRPVALALAMVALPPSHRLTSPLSS
jgi:hypothetical protein